MLAPASSAIDANAFNSELCGIRSVASTSPVHSTLDLPQSLFCLAAGTKSAHEKSSSLPITTSPLIRWVVPGLQTLWYRPVASALSGRPLK
jgi:hypothetical protein